VEHRAELPGELALADSLRRDRVDRALEPAVDREPVDRDKVVQMNPWEPLAAASDRPAGEQAERQRHQPHRRRPRPDHEACANGDVGHSGS
jgi:hypothetical protein